MATTVSASSTQAPLSSSSNANKTLNGSNKGVLRTTTKNTLLTQPAPPSPLLKRAMGRALERTISVHTSMGKPVAKRSIALAPSGPSSSARRLAAKPVPDSPNLKKSNAASYARTTSILVINTPAPASSSSSSSSSSTIEGATLPTGSEETRPELLRRRSSRFDKSVGFDLSNREILKARKLAQKGFEDKTGKSWTLTRNKSQMDIDIYEQEVRKHEARMLSKKQEELDKETEIQKSIDSRQDQITQLQRRVAEKEAELTANKSVAEQAKVDIQNAIKDQIMKGSAITDEKSSDVRMRVEQQKKALKKQMINQTAADDPRRRVLQTQQEVEELRVIINLLKKEIAKIKHDASFEKSSKARMKAAKKAKEDERASGIVKEYKPIKQKVAKPVVQKSHMSRMEAEKQRKLSKKTNNNVTALRSSGGLRESLTLRMRRSGMIRQSSGLRGTGTLKRADLGSSSSASSSSKATVVIAQ